MRLKSVYGRPQMHRQRPVFYLHLLWWLRGNFVWHRCRRMPLSSVYSRQLHRSCELVLMLMWYRLWWGNVWNGFGRMQFKSVCIRLLHTRRIWCLHLHLWQWIFGSVVWCVWDPRYAPFTYFIIHPDTSLGCENCENCWGFSSGRVREFWYAGCCMSPDTPDENNVCHKNIYSLT